MCNANVQNHNPMPPIRRVARSRAQPKPKRAKVAGVARVASSPGALGGDSGLLALPSAEKENSNPTGTPKTPQVATRVKGQTSAKALARAIALTDHWALKVTLFPVHTNVHMRSPCHGPRSPHGDLSHPTASLSAKAVAVT